jgi:hypothetical protein
MKSNQKLRNSSCAPAPRSAGHDSQFFRAAPKDMTFFENSKTCRLLSSFVMSGAHNFARNFQKWLCLVVFGCLWSCWLLPAHCLASPNSASHSRKIENWPKKPAKTSRTQQKPASGIAWLPGTPIRQFSASFVTLVTFCEIRRPIPIFVLPKSLG